MAPLTGDDFHNPKLTGPRASKHIPGGGLFSAYGSAHINAPPQIVYDVLLNVGEYKEWNTFTYDAKITKTHNPHYKAGTRLASGSCMIFYRKFSDNPEKKGEGRHVVTMLEKLKLAKDGHGTPCVTRIRWQLDNAAITTPGFLLRKEETNEIEDMGDGTTKYRVWVVFAGPVAKFLRKDHEGWWRDGMQAWCRDLKERCETKAREGQRPEEKMREEERDKMPTEKAN